MVFNSWTFLAFWILFVPLFAAVRRHVFARNCLLTLASYVFYGWWDTRFLILVAVSTSVDYAAALGAAGLPVRGIDRVKAAVFLAATTLAACAGAGDPRLLPPVAAAIAVFLAAGAAFERLPAGPRRRRAWLAMSLVTNLGILGVFKYLNFFVSSVADLFGALGLHTGTVTLGIVLPVGLSFYTFQAISRTVDCYRGLYRPARNIVDYAAYHAFFPQLVAGPIERVGHLMPQFETVRPITGEMLRSGALLFLWGLFQKIVVADNVGPISDAVFAAPAGQSGGATVAGILAFGVQIYGDFAGYSNMARGVARCMGFDLMRNFDLPYFARTPQEFWRRWHISLSRWLRDYLYIPLGGSRGGMAATCRNLMVTMLIGGLWHGAAWTFVAWGAFHGLVQVGFRAFGIDRLIDRRPATSPAGIALHLASWATTLTLVLLGWVFFRARSFADAAAVLANAARLDGYGTDAFGPLLYYVAPLAAVELGQRFGRHLPPLVAHPPFLVRYTAVLCLVLATVLLSAEAGRQFIYFDF